MIVTFYSYKGGVGRSFCLANVAVQLARWGNRVLCVDFDLDAPGLHEYFRPYLPIPVREGLVEVIGGVDWQDAVVPVAVPEIEGLSLLGAGRMDEDYADRAQALSWPRLFEEDDLGWRFEKMRGEWEESFDYVLIDSRTGITDIGGICTAQLPDVLVLCVAPNQQNLDGVMDVTRRAALARDRLPYDKAGLLHLPVVSRFDGREEYERAGRWRAVIAERFAPLYGSWLPVDSAEDHGLGLVERTTVPYLPYWSFGEDIAAVAERSNNPDTVSYFMDNIAALLAHGLADADVLVSSRDTYVAAARERGGRTTDQGYRYDVLVHGTSPRAAALTDELTRLGVRAVRGRLADVSMARHFLIVDPPARPSAGIQEILDQVQLGQDRVVVGVTGAPPDWPRQLSHVHPIFSSAADTELAVLIVAGLPAADEGRHWERVLVTAATWLWDNGHRLDAVSLAERATRTRTTPIPSMLLYGRLAAAEGRYATAERNLAYVLELVPEQSSEAFLAHRTLGEMYRDAGDLDRAMNHITQAILVGNPHEQALMYRETARIELRRGNVEGAAAALDVALNLSAPDDKPALAVEFAVVQMDRGELVRAANLLDVALRSADALPPDTHLLALRQRAYLYLQLEAPEEADALLRAAFDLALRDLPDELVDIAIERAQLMRDVSSAHSAIRALDDLVRSLPEDDRRDRARLVEAVGNFAFDARDLDLAVRAFVEALGVFRVLQDRAGEVRALIGLTIAHHRGGEQGLALNEWHEARRLVTRLKGPEADLLRRQLDAIDPR